MSHVLKVRILYKLILKLHRGLPEELQVIGTNYARDEFKRHKSCTSQEADVFMKEWTNYAIMLANQLGGKSSNVGNHLPSESIENFSDEQLAQLYELMEAAQAPKESQKS